MSEGGREGKMDGGREERVEITGKYISMHKFCCVNTSQLEDGRYMCSCTGV